MGLGQELVAAARLTEDRWPRGEPGGAAAVRLRDGAILTGVGLDNLNGSLTLCQETGAFIQACTRNIPVTASVCVRRDPERDRVLVLPPCGVRQERLALWGPDAEVAVPHRDDPTDGEARAFAEVNPYSWGLRFADGTRPSTAPHSE
ncbi:cytidine deaminase [Streptomyces nitrosporeus]|uniref:cytidine deaminase n=1 Tax=Streptomyces nitrosporeus TaxID=28894 RepID=UPI00399F1089